MTGKILCLTLINYSAVKSSRVIYNLWEFRHWFLSYCFLETTPAYALGLKCFACLLWGYTLLWDHYWLVSGRLQGHELYGWSYWSGTLPAVLLLLLCGYWLCWMNSCSLHSSVSWNQMLFLCWPCWPTRVNFLLPLHLGPRMISLAHDQGRMGPSAMIRDYLIPYNNTYIGSNIWMVTGYSLGVDVVLREKLSRNNEV